MGIDFKALKERSKAGTSALSKKLEQMNSSGYTPDERIYRPSMSFDKSNGGKGFVVIRFLPCPVETCDDFVSRKYYNFKGKNGYYNETSRKTIGMKEADPVSISNKFYYDKSKDIGDDNFRPKGRNLQEKFYANIMIIKDEFKPENNGKVFIMEFGKKIFEKLQDKIKPEYDEDEALDPFCVFTGANFKIKMSGNEIPDFRDASKKTLVPNYDASEFASPSEFLDGDEDKIMEIINKGHDLSEFIVCKEFDALAEKFLAVTGEAYNKLEQNDPVNEMAKEAMQEFESMTTEVDKAEKVETESKSSKEDKITEEDEDDLMAQFNQLMQED